jgi:hypothetical protein
VLYEGSTGTISVIYTTSVHNGGTGWVAKFTAKNPGISVIKLWNTVKFSEYITMDHLSGLVVRVPGCRSRGPGSICGTTRFSEM